MDDNISLSKNTNKFYCQLCDFKTSQHDRRMGGINYKGVFTRDRRPKMAAHHLRKLWSKNVE